MMSRTQITLEPEIRRRARDMGISLPNTSDGWWLAI